MAGKQRISERSASRRKLLSLTATGGAAVAGVVLAKGLTAEKAAAQAGQHLEGSWLITITPTDQPPEAPRVATFTADGSMISSGHPVQPGPSNSGIAKLYSTAGHGGWVRTGDHQFGLTFLVLQFDDNGQFLATAKIRASIQLNQTQDAWSGTFTLQVIDTGGTVRGSGDGTVAATRIVVEE